MGGEVPLKDEVHNLRLPFLIRYYGGETAYIHCKKIDKKVNIINPKIVDHNYDIYTMRWKANNQLELTDFVNGT